MANTRLITLSGKFGVWAVAGATAVLSGCSHTQPAVTEGYRGTYTPAAPMPAAAGHTIRATTVFTPQGGYQVIQNGSTVTVNQISRVKP